MKRQAKPGAGEFLDHPAADRLVERREELGVPDSGGAADDVELELRACRGGELEQIAGAGRQAGETLADHLAHALGAAELGGRAHQSHLAVGQLDGAGLDEGAPELADQERVAVRQVADRVGPARAARGRAHRLAARRTNSLTSSPERPATRSRTTS